jgi:quinohemoprotein ethanol dehydrogenase
MNITAATLTIGGRRRKVLMQAPTNGFFYVLDRETGKLISAEKTGKVTWAERIDLKTGRPVEAANIRYETGDTTIWPSPVGTHNWQAMSYSPATGLVYIPYMQAGARFTRLPPRTGEMSLGGLSIGMAEAPGDKEEGTASLLAWDPVAQRQAWKVPLPSFWNGGALATRGNLVFQGTGDGKFSAYDGRNGKRLWQVDAGLGIIAAPIAYRAGGRQHVAVLVGYGGSAGAGTGMMQAGWKYGAQPRRLLAFALDGKAALPKTAPSSRRVDAVDDAALKLDAGDVAAGGRLFRSCVNCHGAELRAGGVAPDLRESRLALDREAFWSVLHDGALEHRGMPRYGEFTREEALQLQAYIRAGARKALAASK